MRRTSRTSQSKANTDRRRLSEWLTSLFAPVWHCGSPILQKLRAAMTTTHRNEDPSEIELFVTRLEPRLVLNADFTLVGGVLGDALQLTNFGGDTVVTVGESADGSDYIFQLDNGTWNGDASSAGIDVTGGTLTVEKSLVTDSLQISDSGAGSDLHVDIQTLTTVTDVRVESVGSVIVSGNVGISESVELQAAQVTIAGSLNTTGAIGVPDGDVLIVAKDVEITGSIVAGDGTVTFRHSEPGGTILFGGEALNPYSLQSLEDLDHAGQQGYLFRSGNDQQLGYSISSVGDFNDDGFNDFVISAPGFDAEVSAGSGSSTYSDVGRLFLVFGNPEKLQSLDVVDGTTDGVIDLANLDGSNGFRIDGPLQSSDSDPGGLAGFAVAGGRDINGDGLSDLVIGVPNANYFDDAGNQTAGGAVFVLFGSASPFADVVELENPGSHEVLRIDGTDDARLGVSVALGDINGDGFADIVTGAPRPGTGSVSSFAFDSFSDQSGMVYVIFGNEDLGDNDNTGGTFDLSALSGSGSATLGFTVTGQGSGDGFGRNVATGNFGGDTADDLLIGTAQSGSQNGEAYVLFGRSIDDFETAIDLSSVDGSTSFRFIGRGANAHVNVGDVNDDGFDDFGFGSQFAGADGEGEVRIIFGGNANLLSLDAADTNADGALDIELIDGTTGFRIDGESPFGHAGFSVSGGGDVNGDGIADLIVGAPAAIVDGNRTGAAYVVFGKTTFPSELQLSQLSNSEGWTLSGVADSDRAGSAVSMVGDINGDGRAELLIGTDPASGSGSSTYTDAYLIFGSESHFQIDNDELGLITAEHILIGAVTDSVTIISGADVSFGGNITFATQGEIFVEGNLSTDAGFYTQGPGTTYLRSSVLAGTNPIAASDAIIFQQPVRIGADITLSDRATGVFFENDLAFEAYATATATRTLTIDVSVGSGEIRFGNDTSETTVSLRVAGEDASLMHEQIVTIGGSVSIAPDTELVIEAAPDFFLTPGSELVVMTLDGSDPVIGTFSNSTIILNGITHQIIYDGGDGNDVALIGPN